MAFDELYHKSEIRPLYRRYFHKYSQLKASEHKIALKAARASVGGDADFLPLVRLISSRDYRELVKGVKQRGRALRLFLKDHYIGNKSYERAGIISRSEINKILSRYKLPADQPALHSKNIQFWYAPDIVRDDKGKFRVIEDNVGFVGGFGDLEAFAEATRALGVRIPAARQPRSFYRSMVELYKREARASGGGKVILLSYPQSETYNREDRRLERVLSALQVTPVTNVRSLKVKDNVLFHRGDRVGFVILNVEHEDIGVAGFWQAVNKKQVGVSFTPGIDFVGDKKFCASVEALVKFYLKEKCLLPSLPILDLGNSQALKRVLRDRERWVIKLCKSQSGDSVWVGPHLTAQSWKKILSRVKKQPGDFIAQRYCEPSQFLGHSVDLRPLAVITPSGESVSPIPWGRAARRKKSKTNISCGGLLAPVAVV